MALIPRRGGDQSDFLWEQTVAKIHRIKKILPWFRWPSDYGSPVITDHIKIKGKGILENEDPKETYELRIAKIRLDFMANLNYEEDPFAVEAWQETAFQRNHGQARRMILMSQYYDNIDNVMKKWSDRIKKLPELDRSIAEDHFALEIHPCWFSPPIPEYKYKNPHTTLEMSSDWNYYQYINHNDSSIECIKFYALDIKDLLPAKEDLPSLIFWGVRFRLVKYVSSRQRALMQIANAMRELERRIVEAPINSRISTVDMNTHLSKLKKILKKDIENELPTEYPDTYNLEDVLKEDYHVYF